MKTYPGNVVPAKEGVYVVTTDNPGHWGYFMGYFNGQYWYEYTRADHYDSVNKRPRKKTARLAVTAWAPIDHSQFSNTLRENVKAGTDHAGRSCAISQRGYERATAE